MRIKLQTRWLGCAIAGVVLATFPARSDYLAELGVPALRWKPPQAPNFTALGKLPPLQMGEPLRVTNSAPVAVTNPPPPAPGEFFGPFPEDATAPGARLPALPYQLDGMISPDWLSSMLFFSRTNGLGTLVLPVPFVPPSPPSRPSSATYSRANP